MTVHSDRTPTNPISPLAEVSDFFHHKDKHTLDIHASGTNSIICLNNPYHFMTYVCTKQKPVVHYCI